MCTACAIVVMLGMFAIALFVAQLIKEVGPIDPGIAAQYRCEACSATFAKCLQLPSDERCCEDCKHVPPPNEQA